MGVVGKETGTSDWKGAASPSPTTMAGVTLCPRPHTDFLESTGLDLPDCRLLGPLTPSETRGYCLPLGTQRPPVRLCLPPKELWIRPPAAPPTKPHRRCGRFPFSTRVPAHSQVAGYPGSCSSSTEGKAQHRPWSLQPAGRLKTLRIPSLPYSILGQRFPFVEIFYLDPL